METPFFGEMLILFLLLLNCGRIFFLKYGKVDTLTVLAPVSIVLAVFQIIAWNADLFSISVLIISIFCFLTNFRAFLRFLGGLYVDHYSFAFKLGAILVILLVLAEGILLFYFRPVRLNKKNYQVKTTEFRVSGDFSGTFRKAETLEAASGIIKVTEPSKPEDLNGKAILLISDKRADSINYIPYIKMLASKGFKVYTGDFYARDMKWIHNFCDSKIFRNFYLKLYYFQNPVKFEMQKEFYSYNTGRELQALLDFVEEEKVFVIGDWMSDICFDDLKKEKSEKVSGYFKLTDLDSYKTKGFGFVQYTDPFTAYLLGFKRAENFENLTEIVDSTVLAIPSDIGELDDAE